MPRGFLFVLDRCFFLSLRNEGLNFAPVPVDGIENLMLTHSRRMAPLFWMVPALAFAAGHAPAAIYKWVDEKGVTQYSEKPPQGKKSAEVPIRTSPASGAQSAPKTWQQQEAEFQQRRVEQEERRLKKDALNQAAAEDRMRACMHARQDLHALEQERPVYTVNEKGERVYIEDTDRAGLRDRVRAIVQQACDRQ